MRGHNVRTSEFVFPIHHWFSSREFYPHGDIWQCQTVLVLRAWFRGVLQVCWDTCSHHAVLRTASHNNKMIKMLRVSLLRSCSHFLRCRNYFRVDSKEYYITKPNSILLIFCGNVCCQELCFKHAFRFYLELI